MSIREIVKRRVALELSMAKINLPLDGVEKLNSVPL